MELPAAATPTGPQMTALFTSMSLFSRVSSRSISKRREEALKKRYGDKLVLHGGVDAVLWDNKEAIVEEIRRLIPIMKENGGYIFSSDHSVPNSVSLENFRAIVDEIKIVGKY